LEGTPVTFSNVKVKFDGNTKYTFETPVIPGIDSKEDYKYYQLQCINIWNTDKLGGKDGLFGYVMPRNTIEIEFTVSGFAYDKVEEPAEEAPAEETPKVEPTEAPAKTEETKTDEAKEGGTNWALIAGIVVAVIIVVVVVVLVVKNKKKGQN